MRRALTLALIALVLLLAVGAPWAGALCATLPELCGLAAPQTAAVEVPGSVQAEPPNPSLPSALLRGPPALYLLSQASPTTLREERWCENEGLRRCSPI
jgi:hypothetical protein